MRGRIGEQGKKAAIYTRVSTVWQAKDGDSLPMQREELPKYVEYALGIKHYEIFEDAGYSAKNTDRPDFQRMMSRVRKGEFSHIVVWKLDRISRNLLDFAAMYAELKKLGVVFISKNEQFDTSTAIGEAMLKIILVFAELERNMTSERVHATLISRAQGGQWNGGRVPFGYDHIKGTDEFTVNEKEAAIVRLLYEKYEETSSLVSTARYLNEKKLLPRSGIAWNPTTVRGILVSPFYVGIYRYNYHDESAKTFKAKRSGEWVISENHHVAIIEKERQDAVISTLKERDKLFKMGEKRAHEKWNIHIFAGMVTCGKCGTLFQASSTAERKKKDFSPSIYMCARHRRFKDCDNKSVTDLSLGPFVLNFVSNYLRAQRSFGVSTSLEVLEKKLLRGEFFFGVRIARDSLEAIHRSFHLNKFGERELYRLPDREGDKVEIIDEAAMLEDERRRLERAIQRLKTLYLYSDDAMPEADFVAENGALSASLGEVNRKLAELHIKKEQEPFSDEDNEAFVEQASYLIITEELLSGRYVDYGKLIRTLDRATLKMFIKGIIKTFVVLDGKIEEMVFRNGISVKFLYSCTDDNAGVENEKSL